MTWALVTVSNVNKVTNKPVSQPLSKLKDYKIKLHINPDVTIGAKRHRKTPHSLRPEVEQEIQRLEQLDIIEKLLPCRDNILIHGRTVEEHDTQFKILEQHLPENNLTINETKRVFR